MRENKNIKDKSFKCHSERIDHETLVDKIKNKSSIVCSIALILLALASYIGFSICSNNPKKTLVQSLELWGNSVKIFEKPLLETELPTWNETSLKGTGTVQLGELFTSGLFSEGNEKMESLINKISSLKIGADIRVSQSQKLINIFSNIEEEKLFDITYVNQDQKQYLLLKDVLEKYLQLQEIQDIYGQDIETEELKEELGHVLTVLKKSLQTNLKSSYIKTKNETIIIDGKKRNTINISLLIDSELINHIINDLKTDQRAKEFLVSLYPNFESYEVSKKEQTAQMSYSVNITKGLHKIIKASISISDDFGISIAKGKETMISIMENETVSSLSIKEEASRFRMSLKNTKEENLEIVITGNREKGIYELIANQDQISVISTLSLQLKEVKKDEAYQETVELSLSAKANGMEIDIGTFTFDFDVTKGAIFEEVKDSILITELTEEEKNKIENYLENIGQKFAQ